VAAERWPLGRSRISRTRLSVAYVRPSRSEREVFNTENLDYAIMRGVSKGVEDGPQATRVAACHP
jgi:hypothetical protein